LLAGSVLWPAHSAGRPRGPRQTKKNFLSKEYKFINSGNRLESAKTLEILKIERKFLLTKILSFDAD
jgi:hypothetical protein